ncbi:maternal embryonic leucine zipper [Nesidiocoris tenuis]|uniref:non-specific serine/threonine protein kinase n=1 Tax=Nesidiocoris tenuis TaxID=355587 RepID=A0ABN7A760_9HEMI|nr:maternal embryonic leucine zipper [Nesidiocoris tenuis]
MGRLKYPELRSMYKLERKIGEGGFAKVRLATHLLTGERVAIKIMEKAVLGKDLSRVLSEVEALKSLTHQHITQVYEVINSEDYIFIIMEYCSGGELFDYIVNNKRLSEAEARSFFRQILSAVAFLHTNGYAHRDLKPENILLDNDHNLKLIDFGLCAKPVGGITTCLDTACGSLNYAAPELLLGVKYLGSKADVWSLGVLLYALLCGALPFDDSGTVPGELQKKIIMGSYNEPEYLSALSRQILGAMLQKDPRYRPTTVDLLNHKWVTMECFDPVTYASIYKHHEKDDQVLKVLADYYDLSLEEAWIRLSSWAYDYFTASYLLLLNKKRRGQLGSLNCVRTPIRLRARLRMAHSLPPRAQTPRVLRAGENDIENCSTPLSPSHHSYSQMVENLQDSQTNTDDDVLRLKNSRKRGHDADSDGFASPVPTPVSKRRRTSNINSENRTPTSGTSSPGKFLHSVERKFSRMKNILTPRRKAGADSPAVLHVKDMHDVSVTSSDDPKQVLDDLTSALSSCSILCKSRGFTIRGKVFVDDASKVAEKKKANCKLMFELQVCLIKRGGQNVVGIKRKRLKGDTFYYKKICEQILQLTVK